MGCITSASRTDPDRVQSIGFQVEKADVHFGHSSATADGVYYHPEWLDGCTGRLVASGDLFAVWWVNNEIRDLPFRFEAGKTYMIKFRGEIADGVMAHKGACLHIRQVLDAREVR
jgi:hypothetical protein